jgi:glycosyl hydrolase family 30
MPGRSRFIRPNATRIGATTADGNLRLSAFQNTGGSLVVALNTAGSATSLSYTLPNTHRPDVDHQPVRPALRVPGIDLNASDLYNFLPWRLGLLSQTSSPANTVGGTQ